MVCLTSFSFIKRFADLIAQSGSYTYCLGESIPFTIFIIAYSDDLDASTFFLNYLSANFKVLYVDSETAKSEVFFPLKSTSLEIIFKILSVNILA